MTALLTDNLPLLAGAPNGIKKLRELILELAVRGKLVPQDPSDEPASELLKRIAEEKALSGNLKKTKLLAEITEDEKPFAAPISWVLSRLGHVGEWAVGSGFPTQEQGLTDQPIPFCKVSDMNLSGNERFILTANNSIDESTASRLRVNVHPAGTVIFPKIGGAIATNKRRLLVKPTAIDNNCLGLTPNGTLSSNYLYLLLSSIDLTRYQAGTSVPALSQGVLADIIVGVPPLAEQHRIVAKVDELMALCDRLEVHQDDAENAQAQLVQALLDSLTHASDANGFATSWQRLAEHFHTLFTTESSINALKQTFLRLAADGRLVNSCLPADYPALSDVINGDSLNGSSKKPQDSPSTVEILRISAGTGVSDFLTDEYEHKWADVTKAEIQKFLLVKDDLLACRFNGNLHYVGAFSLYCGNRDVPQIFPDKLIRFRADRSKASPHYLKYILNAAPARAQIESFCATTVGNIGISAKNLKTIKLRLPSLEEQSNIVDLLDQLMAKCEQLKKCLIQARQLNAQLASTLVERALSDKKQQTPAVSDRQVARTLLAAEITHRLHSQRTFGQRKLQKVIYLAEHAARLATIQGDYLRDAAGPHDRQLMNQIEGELQTRRWYERIERETVGYTYLPLSLAGQHQQAYENTWLAEERASIDQVIELMRGWDTDRCEMTVTLYAAWNDFILEGRPVTDEAIVDEVMHSWNDTKLRFGKTEWLAVLAEMKKHKILMPSGFGKRTTGGMLSLPGFE
nr:restriction endonuclease subunit S [uncultured Pseudomonas sp.]